MTFLVGFWLRSIQVELRQFGSRLSKVGSSKCRVESIGPKSNRVGMCQIGNMLFRERADVKTSKPRRYRVEQSRVHVESSRPEPLSSQAISGRCWPEQAQANVEPSGPGSMSSCPDLLSRPGPGRCWVIRAQTDIESSGPKPMSSRPGSMSSCPDLLSRPGPSRCRVVQARADFESSESEPISSRSSSSRCRVVQAWDVEWSGSRPMLSRPGPSWCRVVRAKRLSSRPGPSRCWVFQARADFESSGSWLMSSCSSMSRCQVV